MCMHHMLYIYIIYVYIYTSYRSIYKDTCEEHPITCALERQHVTCALQRQHVTCALERQHVTCALQRQHARSCAHALTSRFTSPYTKRHTHTYKSTKSECTIGRKQLAKRQLHSHNWIYKSIHIHTYKYKHIH